MVLKQRFVFPEHWLLNLTDGVDVLHHSRNGSLLLQDGSNNRYRLAQLACTLGRIDMRKHDVEHHDVEALGFLVILIHFNQIAYLLELLHFYLRQAGPFLLISVRLNDVQPWASLLALLADGCHLLMEQGLQLIMQLLVKFLLLMLGALQLLGNIQAQAEEPVGERFAVGWMTSPCFEKKSKFPHQSKM